MFFSRGKNKIQNPYTWPDIYNDYIEIVGVKGDIYKVSKRDYLDIVTQYSNGVLKHIIDHSGIFKLPSNLGFFQVIKKRPSKNDRESGMRAVDWGYFNSTGKICKHINEHTGGYKYEFVWGKMRYYVKYIHSYRFVLTRAHKRRLAYLLKNNIKDYLEYSSYDAT